MSLFEKILLGYFCLVNLIAFVICFCDKRLAKARKSRISEKTLFLISAIGGSIGMYLGMYVFRHKTNHLSFVLGIPFIMLLQIVIAFLIINKF